MTEAMMIIGMAQDFAGFVATYLRPAVLLIGLPLLALGAWKSYQMLIAQREKL